MGGEHSLPDFSSIKYTRPDIEAYTELVKDVRLRLMTAQTAEQAMEAMNEYEDAMSSFDTAYALCTVLHDLDTSNEFYTAENDFFDENLAMVSELSSAVLSTLLTCPAADKIREKYGDMIFRKAQNTRETISKEILDELAVSSSRRLRSNLPARSLT